MSAFHSDDAPYLEPLPSDNLHIPASPRTADEVAEIRTLSEHEIKNLHRRAGRGHRLAMKLVPIADRLTLGQVRTVRAMYQEDVKGGFYNPDAPKPLTPSVSAAPVGTNAIAAFLERLHSQQGFGDASANDLHSLSVAMTRYGLTQKLAAFNNEDE